MYSLLGHFAQSFSNETVTAMSNQLIGPSPENEAVLRGLNHVLMCSKIDSSVSGNIVWHELLPEGPPILLWVGTAKESLLPKYDNFNISTDGLQTLDLHINQIAPSDEGTYACSLGPTGESHPATCSVEGM